MSEYTEFASDSLRIDHARFVNEYGESGALIHNGWRDNPFGHSLSLLNVFTGHTIGECDCGEIWRDLQNEQILGALAADLNTVPEHLGVHDDVADVGGHWYVRTYRGDVPDNGYTLAARIIMGIGERLEDYPILDDEPYYMRVYESNQQSVRDELEYMGIDWRTLAPNQIEFIHDSVMEQNYCACDISLSLLDELPAAESIVNEDK